MPVRKMEACAHLSPSNFRTILFDLDGTLVDSAPDLLFAVNEVLREEGGQLLCLEDIYPLVSQGSRAMLQRGFGMEPEAPGFAGLMERFLAIYQANIAANTRLFPGMEAVLARIEANHLANPMANPMLWGIVTNKSSWLTEPLVTALGLDRRAACIVSGDSAERAKPYPDTLLLACRRIGVEPAECLYMGDAAKDMEAGRRAGMRTAVALYGYMGPDDRPETWGADCMLPSPGALLDWLNC